MNINIKTSWKSYLTYALIVSPFIIIIPAALALQGKYVSSNYLQVHIILIAVIALLFIYVYQEVNISSKHIILKKYSFSGNKTIKVNFNEITSWSSNNPIKVYIGDNEAMKIIWTVFSKSDQKKLIECFINLGVKQI